ncbi:spermidine synthase-like [Dysidea avara]|uniref:spermidine synthase-like n=1 Tax=Dysidea avara TaxID=196820 RepID=UPI00332181AE
MNSIHKGWFTETNPLWPGQAMSLEVSEVLHEEQSSYQDILVIKSKNYGNVLVLDGIIQCTERDEFSYQEMITHLPMFSHPCPKKVLVIGGGDGGVLREVIKHDCVEEVHLCEIDTRVIEVSKKYLPTMSVVFDHPKVHVHNKDGAEFLKENDKPYFDVVITDSSDPIGPAKSLFAVEYYQSIKEALKPDGVLCCQGECQWLHLDLIKNIMSFCRDMFPVTSYAYTTIPTYPSGQIGFILCSNSKNTCFEVPLRKVTDADVQDMKLKYYNSAIHSAAFVLPQFATAALAENSSS